MRDVSDVVVWTLRSIDSPCPEGSLALATLSRCLIVDMGSKSWQAMLTLAPCLQLGYSRVRGMRATTIWILVHTKAG